VIEDPLPEELPDGLLDLMRHAAHLGLEAVATHGSPLMPFALVESGDIRRAEAFGPTSGAARPSLEECVERMRERAPLLAFEADRAAVVYDGSMSVDEGDERDAVFVEGIEGGMGTSATLAQPYQRRGRRGRVRRLGDPLLMEQGRHFIR
jgi:hypothetical protein